MKSLNLLILFSVSACLMFSCEQSEEKYDEKFLCKDFYVWDCYRDCDSNYGCKAEDNICVDDCGDCFSKTSTCGSFCSDLKSDKKNCGKCFNECEEGSCYDCCGGVCTDLNESNNNCGECFNICGDELYCSSGECVKKQSK